VKAEEYEMPPFIKGHIEVDGNDLIEQYRDADRIDEIEEIGFNEDC
jgi:hypothetical protein